jgi:two-component system, LuxR family, response regulator FixJ
MTVSISQGAGQTDGAGFPGAERLTPREREVLDQIVAGCSNKEVGRRLKISPRTVETHRASLMTKLGARNAADLVRIAMGGNGALNGPGDGTV